jgi:hypothetical protein
MTMETLWTKLAETWCRLAHGAPMWPIRGKYRCSTCFRTYAVAWEAAPEDTRGSAWGRPHSAIHITSAEAFR